MFIVLEGIDGSGTTTQAARLTDYLRRAGKEHFVTAEPTDREIGRFIRSALRGDKKFLPRTLQYLFFADREEHVRNEIEPALRQGKIVICDRYYVSSIAYATLSGDAKPCYDLAQYLPEPDLSIYLRIDVDEALKRLRLRPGQQEIFEKKELLDQIATAYDAIFAKIPEAKKLVIDATKSIDQIEQEIIARTRI